MKTITIYEEFDGYIDDIPYRLLEFDEDYHGEYISDLRFDDLKKVKELNPLLKWVWFFLNEYSNGSVDDGYPIYLFHVTPKQISDVLGFDEDSVDMALKRLIGIGVIKKYDINGIDHIYAVTSNFKA